MNKRFISLMLGVLMLLSVIAPVGVLAEEVTDGGGAATQTNKTKIVIHKIKLEGPGIEATEAPNKKYDGSKISDLNDYFGANQKPVELNGVTFTYWKVTKEQYNTMKTTPGDYETKEAVNGYLKDDENTGETTAPTAKGAGVTVADLVDGYYWFVENVNSKVEGGAIAETAAVPFGLILPTYNKNNIRFDNADNPLHVYPKNTVKKPKTDKNFDEAGIDLDQNDRVKEKKSATIGDEIPYFVKTEIPVGSRYKTAHWSDQMTEGLTFNEGSLKVKVKNDNNTSGVDLEKDTDYTLSTVGNGFDLKFKDAGLDKINKQTKVAYVEITYNATLNSKAIVAIPESNDVTFHYGNNPDNGNTPIPTKPENGEITVTKDWAEGTAPEGVTVKFTLYNAQTGAKIESKDLTGDSVTFSGLDNDTEYKVVETYNGYSAEYQKTANGQITVVNHKDNNPEPLKPSSPQVETYGKRFVKTDSKEGAAMERLAGAEFIVRKGTNQYLVKKSQQGSDEDLKEYLKAKHAYENYIADHNTDNVVQEKVKELMAARDAAFAKASTQYEWITIDDLNSDMKKSITNNGTVTITKGEESTTYNIVKLVSDNQGRFEITGLEKGSYNLIETKKPSEEFADRDPIAFEVNKGSYKGGKEDDVIEHIKYDTADDAKDKTAQRVINKKVTIPQTGGMGTIIFTVVGLAIMTVALTSLRKRSHEQ